MARHILVRKAFVYPGARQPKAPDGCHYEPQAGAWFINSTSEALVASKDPRKPRPTTKKADVETGEDNKGE
jgi:hypothetical protein